MNPRIPVTVSAFLTLALFAGAAPARAQGFIIVSKDTDFRDRSYVEGFPPKVIWLDVGNARTGAIVQLLRQQRQRVEGFEGLDETSLLILSIGPSAI